MEQWVRRLLKRQNNSTATTTAPANVPSDTTGTDYNTSLPNLNSSSSVAYSGNSSHHAVAATSFSSDKPTGTSTSTQSVVSAQESKAAANHSLSNGTVAGIVVGSSFGLAWITFFVTFFCIRRKRRSRSRRRRQRPSNGVPTLRKIKDRPIAAQTSGNPSLFENYLPQSADDNTVKTRARTTLEQIEFHVETFYQNLPDFSTSNSENQLAAFDSPYITAPLVTLLSQSEDTMPLILHSLAYFVTASISPINGAAHSLLPIEFITLPSSFGSLESDLLTTAGKIHCCAKTGHFLVP